MILCDGIGVWGIGVWNTVNMECSSSRSRPGVTKAKFRIHVQHKSKRFGGRKDEKQTYRDDHLHVLG